MRPTRVLLVEDDLEQASLISKILDKTSNDFEINWEPRLSEGLERLEQGGTDLIILDLGLPDSQGLDTFIRIYKKVPEVPIVVLTGLADEKLGLAAIRLGAQDYLIKGSIDLIALDRTIRYAMERRRFQEALLAERHRLFKLLETLPVVVFVRDPDYAIHFANRQFEDLMGSWEGKRCYKVIHGRTSPCADCPSIEVFQTQKSHMRELSWSNHRMYQIYQYPFTDREGAPLILSMGIDITEQKQAEEALRQSQKDLNRAQTVAQIGSWRLDVWSNELLWSDEIYRIFGIPEGRQMTYEAFLTSVHPGDREYVNRKWQAALSGESYDIEHRIVVGDTVKWVRERAELEYDQQGLLLGGLGTIQDITRSKKAEAAIKEQEDQLATIYENAPLIMVLLDRDRRVRRMNKLAEQFAGREASELIGKYGGEALGCLNALDDPKGCGFGPHCQECTVRRTVLDTFETGRSHHQVEACLPFAVDGKAQEVTFLLCTAHLTVQGQPQVLVTIQDISERKRMEEAQKYSEEKLRFLTTRLLTAQEDERKRLSQGLHDELGHALLTMKLDLGAIGKQLLPEQLELIENVSELMGYVDEVVENVRRLYLDLIPGDLEDLGLTAALKNLCEEFGRHQEKISWSVHLENIDSLLPVSVQTAIYRIFQEILTNIGKHADPTQVSVLAKQSDNRAIFEVEDNGRGFDMQGGWQSSPKAGMGLLAMEERIRMLGGDLRLWSRRNQGTTITFEIPLEA